MPDKISHAFLTLYTRGPRVLLSTSKPPCLTGAERRYERAPRGARVYFSRTMHPAATTTDSREAGALQAGEFRPITHGAQLVSTRAKGFQLVETRHAARVALQKHAHADASVNFVITGSVRETVGDIARRREYDCGPGSLLYKPAGEYHANVYGSTGARCLIIQPSAATLRNLIDAGLRVSDNPFPVDPRPAQIAARIYAELRRGGDLSSLGIETGVLTLFSLLSRGKRSRAKPPWLPQARDYLAENSRSTIVLRDLALALDVEPAELSRAFHAAYGLTPSDFVRRQRTRWAAAKLSQGTRRLSEIGLRAGFVDQSHFSRTFRAHYGMTPLQYRTLTAR